MTASFDVVVIGSGIGGLTAALTVAREGRSVAVLESGKQFGGYINPFKRRKYHFDPGVHYIGELGPGQGFRKMLERMELQGLEFVELAPDGFDRYVFPTYDVENCRGLARFRDRLARDFPSEAHGLERLFRLVMELADARRALMRAKTPPAQAWAMLRSLRVFRWHKATLAELLTHYIRDPRLAAALAAPVGDLGLPPSRVSALAHLGVLAHYGEGAFMPKGGCGKLRDAFVRALADRDVTLRRNARVEVIETHAGRVHAVRLADGERILAKQVISNASVQATYGMLESMVVPASVHTKLDRVRNSYGSFCIFAGLGPGIDSSRVGAANIWHYPSLDIEACYRHADSGLPSIESGYFLSVPTNKDPEGQLAPPGHTAVQIVALTAGEPFRQWFEAPVMRRGSDYADLKQSLAEPFLRDAERYVPGLRDHIEVLEVATPATNWSFTRSPEGSIYGPDHAPDQMGRGRFDVRSPVEGLFLCGAAIVSAGVYPCAVSGRIAGKLALADTQTRARVSSAPRRDAPAAHVA